MIEGFYGQPWSTDQTASMLAWMGAHRMNTFIDASKNDPYKRTQWRAPFPDAELAGFHTLITAAGAAGVRYVPEVSPGYPEIPDTNNPEAPGQDICFSCAADQQLLISKLQSLWDLGARAFAVDFDDSLESVTHPQDVAAYGPGTAGYGAANAAILNLVYRHFAALDSRFTLFTVPAEYSGTTSSPYLSALKDALDPHVVVMWTGTAVISKTITCADVAGYANAIGRQPLLWDNFPVNDVWTAKPVIGPYRGRAADLGGCMKGIVSNPALQVQADRIPLATIADYLNDPSHYEPASSWAAAVKAFAGDQSGELSYLVDNLHSTPLDATESIGFSRLRDALVASMATPHWQNAYSALRAYLVAAVAAPAVLRKSFRNHELVHEMDHLVDDHAFFSTGSTYSALDRLATESGYGLAAADAMASTRPQVVANLAGGRLSGHVVPPKGSSGIATDLATVNADLAGVTGYPDVVYGDRTSADCTIAQDAEGFPCGSNAMDDLLTAASARLRSYAPQADQAASTVTVTVDGKQVALDAQDRFSLATRARSAIVTATDGAGQQTSSSVSVSVTPSPIGKGGRSQRTATGLGPTVRRPDSLAATGLGAGVPLVAAALLVMALLLLPGRAKRRA